MNNDKQPRRGVWTPDLLAEGPEKRRVHLEQRRQQLAPVLADIRRLVAEVEADLNEREKLPGDLPFQAGMRARHTLKPLEQVVEDLENVITHLTTYNARYTRSYEALPERRHAKEAEKQRLKELKASGGQQQIEAPPAPQAEPVVDPSALFSHLKRTG